MTSPELGDQPDRPFELVCFDIAGTTIADGDAVTAAFSQAYTAVGGPEDRRGLYDRFVWDTMGRSKVDVFGEWFEDGVVARKANDAFEDCYAGFIDEGRCQPIPGAEQTIADLRSQGVAVALTTGFSPTTRDRLLERVGWRDIADVVLSPAEAGRGRPFPDMVLTALLRTGARRVQAVAVVGDTPSDVRAGCWSGAGLSVGVLTGGVEASRLFAAGASAVCPSVVDVPAVLGLRPGP